MRNILAAGVLAAAAGGAMAQANVSFLGDAQVTQGQSTTIDVVVDWSNLVGSFEFVGYEGDLVFSQDAGADVGFAMNPTFPADDGFLIFNTNGTGSPSGRSGVQFFDPAGIDSDTNAVLVGTLTYQAPMDYVGLVDLDIDMSTVLVTLLEGNVLIASGAGRTDFVLTVDTFRFTVNAIPTPGAAAVMGMAGLVGLRRRR